MIELVVFDLDGTLVDSVCDLATAVNNALAEAAPGTPPLSPAVVREYVGDGATVLLTRAIGHVGLSMTASEVLPAFLRCYDVCLLDTTRPYDGIEEALLELEDHPLAVLTNKPGPLARRLLNELGLARHFQRIFGPEDVPARKPDPASLETLMRELRATPASTVMVGDSPVDIAVGQAVGSRTLGVLWGLRPEEVRTTRPDALCERPRDLPRILAGLGVPSRRGAPGALRDNL